MILLLKFFLAHLAGDFLLQTKAMVKARDVKKLRAWQLYVHCLLHGLLTLLLVWDWQFLKWALLIVLSHFLIDSIKLLIQNQKNHRILFFADQLLHIVSLYLIWLWYEDKNFPFAIFMQENFLLLATAIIFLTTPVSFTVKIFISRWKPHTEDDENSLQSAGKNIGIIERLLVFIFIVISQWQAIGFLLAAKSVFRFGDLKESKDRNLTEYILIGTLLSFGIAIFTGMAYQYLKY